MPEMVEAYSEAWRQFIDMMKQQCKVASKEFGLKDNTTATVFNAFISLLEENLQTFDAQMNYPLPGTCHPDQDPDGKRDYDEAFQIHWQYRIFVKHVFYSDEEDAQSSQRTFTGTDQG